MTQNELVTLKEYVEKLICSMDEKSNLRDVALQSQMDAAAEALEARMELGTKNDLEALADRGLRESPHHHDHRYRDHFRSRRGNRFRYE